MKEQKIRLNRYLCSTIEELNVIVSNCVFNMHEEKSSYQSMSNYINDNRSIIVFVNDDNNEFDCYCSRENTCEKCTSDYRKCFSRTELSEIRDAKLFLRAKKLERILL